MRRLAGGGRLKRRRGRKRKRRDRKARFKGVSGTRRKCTRKRRYPNKLAADVAALQHGKPTV